MHQFGSSAHGIEGEATRIAEHIEHPFATGIFFQQGTVLALVNEETGLLPTQPIHVEPEAVLQGCVIIGTTNDEAVLLTKFGLEGQRGLALVEHVHDAVSHHFHQGSGNLFAADVNAHAMSLHDGCLSVAVDHQPGQVVALAMNKPVGVVQRVVGYTDRDTHAEGRCQTALPERFVYLNIPKRKHTHGNGSNLIVAYGDETAVFCQHTHEIAFPDAFIHPEDGPREHPGMKAEQALFLSFL